MQALATVAANEGAACLFVMPWLVHRTRLHGRKDVNQSRIANARRENLLNAIFLAEGLHALDVLDLHPSLGHQPFGVRTNRIAERLPNCLA